MKRTMLSRSQKMSKNAGEFEECTESEEVLEQEKLSCAVPLDVRNPWIQNSKSDPPFIDSESASVLTSASRSDIYNYGSLASIIVLRWIRALIE